MRLCAATIALVLVLLGSGAANAGPAGTVVALSGQCVVQSGGARSYLALGAVIQVGDTIEVPENAKAKIRMTDGSVISLAASTGAAITAYDGAGGRNAKISLTQGLLRAVVAPVGGTPNFEVETAVGTAAVRSTDWFAQALSASMQVAVRIGSIAFTSRSTGRAIGVPAMAGSRVSAGGDPEPLRAWTEAEFQALIAQTEPPVAPAQPAAPPPGGYGPPPGGTYDPYPGYPPPAAPYNPYPVYTPPVAPYNPYPGGFVPVIPGGVFNPFPGGGYTPGGRPSGGYTPGGRPSTGGGGHSHPEGSTPSTGGKRRGDPG